MIVEWSEPLEHEKPLYSTTTAADTTAITTTYKHFSVFDMEWLRKQGYSKHGFDKKKEDLCQWKRWTKSDLKMDDLWCSYEEFMDPSGQDQGLYRVLKQLEHYGLALLRGVPLEDRKVEDVARRFGPIRETFYGRSWDVKSVQDAKNIAYTSLFLDLHMDLM